MITSHTLNARRKQSGITLIEVSIGLIIAAIVAAAAFIAFQNNARRSEVQDNIKQITEIISETKQKVGATSGYAGLNNTIAAQLSILSSATVDNSYGGAIQLAAASAADDSLATLSWPNIEGDQCSDLALAVANGVNSFTVGTGSTGSTVTVANGQLTLAQTTEICGTGDAPVNLVMTFGRR